MTRVRFEFLFIGLAVAAFAFLLLNAWSVRNAPLWKRFERQWTADVRMLEDSGKLPPAWFDVKEIEISGGTPETRGWLRLIHPPLNKSPEGKHRMDVLVVAWEEDGKRGALVQYNIEDIKTKNTEHEIGRTFILSTPPTAFERWVFN